MIKEKLYLICPDCHIELAIKSKFDQNAYFITALGAVFHNYVQTIEHFVDRKMISEIIIVNDTHCTFIENTICKKNYGTNEELELRRLQHNHAEAFASLAGIKQQELLAKLNIYRQAYEILEDDALVHKINEQSIILSGLTYNRESAVFEYLALPF